MRWVAGPLVFAVLAAGCSGAVDTADSMAVSDTPTKDEGVRAVIAGYEGDYVPPEDDSSFRYDLDNGPMGDGQLASWFVEDWIVTDPLHPESLVRQVSSSGQLIGEEREPMFGRARGDAGSDGSRAAFLPVEVGPLAQPRSAQALWATVDTLVRAVAPAEPAADLCPVRDGAADDPLVLPNLGDAIPSEQAVAIVGDHEPAAEMLARPGMEIQYALSAYRSSQARLQDGELTEWCVTPGAYWAITVTDLDAWENGTFESTADLPPLVTVALDAGTGELVHLADYRDGWPRLVELFEDNAWSHDRFLPTLPGERAAAEWPFDVGPNSTIVFLLAVTSQRPLGASEEAWHVVDPAGESRELEADDDGLVQFLEDAPEAGEWTLRYSYAFLGLDGRFEGYRDGFYFGDV